MLITFPNFSENFILETDASGSGLVAVLAYEQKAGIVKPICYASRTHEKNYRVSDLEALAVVWAIRHFCVYLYGHKCKVFTDHEALLSLLNTPHPSGKLARWGLALQELDLMIHYRPGKLNQSVDCLSQCLQSNCTHEDPLREHPTQLWSLSTGLSKQGQHTISGNACGFNARYTTRWF